MNLKKCFVDISSAVFDSRTYVENHVLHIDKARLFEVVNDARFASVDLDIALPGTKTRITNVGDIVQPMCKIDDPKASFPGTVGAMRSAGTGRTLVLRGVAVVEVSEMPLPIGTLIDMWGPGVEHSPFGKTVNVTIAPVPAEGLDRDKYLEALNMASLKAAEYLAEAVKDCEPDEIQEFTLERPNLDGLPRVAYLFQVFSHAPLTDFLYYGDSGLTMLPAVVHPNEIIDGALVNRDYPQLTNADPTYTYQNHPMILDLYKRHGVDINFVGVVMSNTPHTVVGKQRNAMMASDLVKYHLKADGVIITKEGGGHPQIDIQVNCELCEKLGVKTAILVSEFLSPTNASEEMLLFNSPVADAIVTSGCFEDLTLPAPEKVIGHVWIPDPTRRNKCDPATSFWHKNRYVRGSMSQLGGTMYTSDKF